LDQQTMLDTHYILQTSNYLVKSMPKPPFVSSFAKAHNASWTQKKAYLMNQTSFFEEVYSLSFDMFLDAQAVYFTSTINYVNPISYNLKDAMSRPGVKEWREARCDKKMIGFKNKMFLLVNRPTDWKFAIHLVQQ
jgi:hypothetical protein